MYLFRFNIDDKNTVRIKTPVTYYGGKYNMIKQIVPIVDECIKKNKIRCYVEPFVGGGAVFFAKKEPTNDFVNVINDIDNNIMCFYKALRDEPNFIKDDRLLQHSSKVMFEYCRKIFEENYSKEDFIKNINNKINDFELKKAKAIYYIANNSYNSGFEGYVVETTNRKITRYHNKVKALSNDFYLNYIEKKMRNTQIENRDAFELIKIKANRSDVFFYLDPPYVNAVQSYLNKFYQEDLLRLLDALKNVKFKFILSHFSSDFLVNYVNEHNKSNNEKWFYKTIKQFKLKKIKEEILISNFPFEIKENVKFIYY